MNIGYLCGEYPPCRNGGIGTFTKEIAEGLTARGHKIVVFGIYYETVLKVSSPIFEIINNISIYRYPFIKYTKNSYLDELINRFRLFLYIKGLIKEHRLDLIEGYDSTGLLPIRLKLPLVTRLHGSVTFFGRELKRPFSGFTSLLERIQLKKSALIIGVSKYVLDRSYKYFNIKNRSIVIYNSVKPYKNLTRGEENLILYYGLIAPKKGSEQLIHAIIKVLNVSPEYKLYLIGKSSTMPNGHSYSEFLKSLLPCELQGKVFFYDAMSKEDLLNYVSNSFCCVFPSYIECFALAPMEAMALGKPVIYSKLHSGPELIKDGYDGLLVDPSNINEIAEKILSLIQDKNYARKLGENAQNSIQTNFNYDQWIIENERAYEGLLN
jgi:glycosyltransferase involved in cell wall biosynthesis